MELSSFSDVNELSMLAENGLLTFNASYFEISGQRSKTEDGLAAIVVRDLPRFQLQTWNVALLSFYYQRKPSCYTP